MTMIKWISEETALPRVAQHVLLATPRQMGEFWDLAVAKLLIQHEDVQPVPVRVGERWPTTFYWSRSQLVRDTCLITGNGWWAAMNGIPLPPGAVHHNSQGYDLIQQIGDVFISQRAHGQ